MTLHPVRELRAFVEAALVEPVPRDHRESLAVLRRRQLVTLVTLVVGAVVLGVTLRIEPGDDRFYVGGLVLALVWAVGGLAAGRLHVGWAHTREEGLARPVVQPVALAVLIVALFLAGAVVVGAVPWLAERVDDVLDHARYGSLPLVWAITVVTGVAEELFFRGALFAAVQRHAVAVTTVVYGLVTAATGNLMLTFAALLLGLLTGAQRRVTGGVLAPIITHVIWSSSMLFLLPPTLDLLR